MNQKFSMQDIKAIRGFKAITQEEERVENMLLDNINELKSKPRGTSKTRKYLLGSEFDNESLKKFAQLSQEVSEKNIDWKENPTLLIVGKDLFEKIIRGFAPQDAVPIFSDFILNRAKVFNSMDDAIASVKKYLTSGRVPAIGQILEESEKEIKKGEYLYHVPA